MTALKPPAQVNPPEPHDPYRLRTLEQILSLFDGGEFLEKVLDGHKQLQLELIEHKAEHGTKGCQGSMTLQVSYALGKSGDVAMGAKVDFKSPKKPPSSAAAYIDEDTGELTLFSPFMARMQHPPRDVTENYDPVTGEIRDID
jgi:hypothetical protein